MNLLNHSDDLVAAHARKQTPQMISNLAKGYGAAGAQKKMGIAMKSTGRVLPFAFLGNTVLQEWKTLNETWEETSY